MRSVFNFFWETFKIIAIALLIVVPIRYFLFQPFFVKGQSMEPNFENGDYLIIDEITYRFRAPERGEVVVFKYPNDPSQKYIKRIIGLPGETAQVQDSKVIILDKDGKNVSLDESVYLSGVLTPGTAKATLLRDEYFVLGDNRYASSDSRSWGVLPRDNIIGRALIRAWPLKEFAIW